MLKHQDEIEFAHLLKLWGAGDAEARNLLISRLMQELASIASGHLRNERKPISLFTGDLLNEAILRLLKVNVINLSDRSHFLALASRVMRQVLIDAARRRARDKRDERNLITIMPGGSEQAVDLLNLEEALQRLSRIDPRRARIVEMRYFGGMTIEEVALAQGISPATVKRSWEAARLWLQEALSHGL